MNSTPEPETVIPRVIAAALRELNTISIGYIEDYDAARCEATIQPARMGPFRNEFGERVPYKRSPIPHVPVYFPSGGGIRDTWPVQRGDACILLHCSGPIARWLVAGGIVDENNDAMRHNVSSTIALAGIIDFGHVKAAHANARVVGEGAGSLLLGGQDASDPVVRKSDLDAVVQSIKSDLALLKTHIHPAPGGATSASATLTTIGGVTTPACSPVVSSK